MYILKNPRNCTNTKIITSASDIYSRKLKISNDKKKKMKVELSIVG